MQEKELNWETAAEELANQIRKLAENGRIDTLSMKIHGWSSDILFKLAENVGIKELTITAMSEVSR